MTSGRDRDPIYVVTAADDRYAMPLAVMVRSLVDNLGTKKRLILYVLDGGITPANKRKILASWNPGGVALEWIRPRSIRLNRLLITERFGAVAYYRLLIPEILPLAARKAIYLDADTVVLEDIGKLWDIDLRGHPLGAVEDPYIPRVSKGLLNYRKLGIAPSAKYFNSGVLLMDLDCWRVEGIAERVITYAESNRRYLRFPDQDALNAVLAERWLPLSPRWNAVLNALWFRHSKANGAARRELREVIRRPSVLHFLAGPKPWQPGTVFHRSFLFFHYLDQTRWAGWRPPKELPEEVRSRSLRSARSRSLRSSGSRRGG